jgi:leucyl aminopeptidase
MNTRLAFGPLAQSPVDLLVVVLDEEKTLHETVDLALAPHLARALAGFREKTLKREYFATLPEGGPVGALVVYWSPSLKSFNLWENVKTFVARGLRLARDYRLPRVGVLVNASDAAPLVGKVIEGAVLGVYTFDKYRQEKDEFLAKEVQLTVFVHPDHQADAEARKARYAWVSENVNRCRDLINEPGSAVTPEVIADKAGDIAKELGLEIEILDPAGLKARGYHGLVQVGQGSIHPPRMVILRHVPRQPSKETIALVGKGITFDSGGISLKPGDHMWEMKGDMAGAAAVLYAMRAIGRLKPDVRVIGILCCAENMPDAAAQRGHLVEAVRIPVEIFRHVACTDELAVGVIDPAVVRAGELACIAVCFETNEGAAVTAHVRERPDRAVLTAHDDCRFTADLHDFEVAGPGQL